VGQASDADFVVRPSSRSRRRAKHVLAATADLADEIASTFGQATPRVEHARAEIARLRG
jgi:hypothetical protein